MKLTEKLGLKKPDLTDYVNIGDLNDNMDILDETVGELKDGSTIIEELQTENKTLSGAINEIKAEVDLKETPSEAQAKASEALSSANAYTDQEVGGVDTKVGPLTSLTTVDQTNLVAAVNEVNADLVTHKADIATHAINKNSLISTHKGLDVVNRDSEPLTIFEINKPTILLGGSILTKGYVKFKLIVDGVTVLNPSYFNLDASSTVRLNSYMLPKVVCETSMILEVDITVSGAQDCGWVVYTKDA